MKRKTAKKPAAGAKKKPAAKKKGAGLEKALGAKPLATGGVGVRAGITKVQGKAKGKGKP